MTLTIKDSLESASQSKTGSPSHSSENKSGSSPRSNPVCLEVPVTVRSLPGQQGNAPGAAGPTREEGRTVIVFDNGAVLRLSNNLAAGLSVILSNAQGRDVVCRVVNGRNLPTVKGYIEVEFIEPVNDFWRIHQTAEPVRPPVSASPVMAAPQPVPVAESAPQPAAPSVVVPEKQPPSASGSAPTFEDIAGLVNMPSAAGSRTKATETSARAGAPKSEGESSYSQTAVAKPVSVSSLIDFTADTSSKTSAAPAAREFTSVPEHRTALTNDVLGRTMARAAGSSSLPSAASESRGPIPLVLGGAALVLAGFGAAYFFMHRGTPAPQPASAAAATLPASVTPPITTDAAVPAQPLQPVAEDAPIQPQPAAVVPAVVSEPKASSDADNIRRPAGNTEAKQPERPAKQKVQIPNLKMSSPTAPTASAAKLSSGSVPAPDAVPAVALGAVSAPVSLPSTIRSENQPVPPTPSPIALGSAAPVANAIRQPRMISSVQPKYPPMAKQSNVQGKVVVEADVDPTGKVTTVKAISGPALLREAAIDAVHQWRYAPAMLDGKATSGHVSVEVEFRLH